MSANDDPFDGDFSLFLQVRVMLRCSSYSEKRKDQAPAYQCNVCQTSLPSEPGPPHQFEIDLKALDAPTFYIRLDAPAVVCPRCGRHVILWSDETAAQLEQAISQALST